MSMSHPKDYDSISQQPITSGANAAVPRYATIEQFEPRVPQLDIGMDRDGTSHLGVSSASVGAVYHTSSDGQNPTSHSTYSTNPTDVQHGGYVRRNAFPGPASAASVEASQARATDSPQMSPKTTVVKSEANEIDIDEDPEDDDDEVGESKTMTAEEIRRQKRKMKRFR